jgi:hypothetical protein
MFDNDKLNYTKFKMDRDFDYHIDDLNDLDCDGITDGFTDAQDFDDFDYDLWDEFTL